MIGFDIDGVFVNDVHTPALTCGTLSVSDMLNVRKHLVPLFTLFNLGCALNATSFFLVTARPSTDRKDTEVWMAQHFSDYGQLELVMRSDTTVADIETAARFKAQTIGRLGLQKFVESCPHQASLIKDLQPQCKVIQFSKLVERALEEALR